MSLASGDDEPIAIPESTPGYLHAPNVDDPVLQAAGSSVHIPERLDRYCPKPIRDWLAERDNAAGVPCDSLQWYEAVSFCRWLGVQKGLAESDQPCLALQLPEMVDVERESNSDANWAIRD